jgi:hypothetical protein
MNLLRGLLFENFSIKLLAILLSTLVYVNARTDRPVTMMVSFPVAIQDLPDSVSLAGPPPPPVHAEIRGTGKQVIRLRLARPPITISLTGVGPGHFERSITPEDLPLPPGLDLEQVVGPRMVVLELDRRLSRRVPVSSRIEWTQPSAARPIARIVLEPANVTVTGPARVVTRLDTVALAPVRLDGRRDSLRVDVWPGGLPEGCIMEPPAVRLLVVLGRAHP